MKLRRWPFIVNGAICIVLWALAWISQQPTERAIYFVGGLTLLSIANAIKD